MNRRQSSARSEIRTVVALGAAQTLAWGSSYYLPAMLATAMARDLGVPTPTVFAAFSSALVISAVVGPLAGRAIARRGGRAVLMFSNAVFAIGLCALGLSHDAWALFAAWAIIGIGMGSGLYDAAFATIVRLYREESRNCITGITLIAGFASTVGWPLSAWLEVRYGWEVVGVAQDEHGVTVTSRELENWPSGRTTSSTTCRETSGPGCKKRLGWKSRRGVSEEA